MEPYPTEVPLTSDEPFIRARDLQGLSLRDVTVTIQGPNGKALTMQEGDMIFTHVGLSGPAALRCSHYVSTSLRKDPLVALTARIDCLPGRTHAECEATLERMRQSDGRKHLSNMLAQWAPERLTRVMLTTANVNGSTQMAQLTNDAIRRICAAVKEFPVRITGTLPLAQATVTGGGVSVKEIDPKTMGSKLCDGLYFAGELMDVHAHTGGYNITVAFSTGHCAGNSAALHSLSRSGNL